MRAKLNKIVNGQENLGFLVGGEYDVESFDDVNVWLISSSGFKESFLKYKVDFVYEVGDKFMIVGERNGRLTPVDPMGVYIVNSFEGFGYELVRFVCFKTRSVLLIPINDVKFLSPDQIVNSERKDKAEKILEKTGVEALRHSVDFSEIEEASREFIESIAKNHGITTDLKTSKNHDTHYKKAAESLGIEPVTLMENNLLSDIPKEFHERILRNFRVSMALKYQLRLGNKDSIEKEIDKAENWLCRARTGVFRGVNR